MKLVFVHGAGESSLSFHYQTRRFHGATGVDLPGHHAGSPCTSIEAYVEWVRGFIAGREYEDVVLCGHSMGGAITQLYALTYPDELKGIVLIGTGARLRVDPTYLKRCEDAVRGRQDDWLDGRRAAYSRIAPDIRQDLLQRANEVGPAVELNDLLSCDRFDIMDSVADIRVPALIICGAEDVMTPVKYTDYLADRISGARKLVVEGATHFVQLERNEEVGLAIEEFLATLDARAAG